METDITTLRIDAIVASDDTSGRMRGNAAAAIKRVGGLEIEQESVTQGPFAQGDAWSTEAGSLAVRWIIHVAATDQTDTTDSEVSGSAGIIPNPARRLSSDGVRLAAVLPLRR